MRLRRLLITAACALAAAPLSAAAQVRGGGPPPSTPATPSTPPRGGTLPPRHEAMPGGGEFATTRSLSGEIREVNLDEGYIVVADPKKGTGKFYVGDKTRLKADKETPLGGKNKLTLEDFQTGQTVKVTFWPDSFKATEVRVRQPKS